jgi:hypothetical protein
MMKKIFIWGIIISIIVYLSSCAASSKRKSGHYYNENKIAINDLRQVYEKLYDQQPLSIGFTDKSYKYYVMEVKTDTLRSIFNTNQSPEQLYGLIKKFNYDTAMLKDLSHKMKAIKCLWLSKSAFYVNKKRETVTFLSFESATSEKIFVEKKYYILVFLNHPIVSQDFNKRIEKGDLVKINDLVYYLIGNNFR